jgi:hypothetical protein
VSGLGALRRRGTWPEAASRLSGEQLHDAGNGACVAGNAAGQSAYFPRDARAAKIPDPNKTVA